MSREHRECVLYELCTKRNLKRQNIIKGWTVHELAINLVGQTPG